MPEILLPDAIQSVHELRTKTQDSRDLFVGSGWVLFGLKGSMDGQWNRRDLRFDVGPQWKVGSGQVSRVQIVPMVALASIMNEKVANDAGWAVDDCAVEFSQPPDKLSERCKLVCAIAVRDRDGIMFRLSYNVTMVGVLR